MGGHGSPWEGEIDFMDGLWAGGDGSRGDQVLWRDYQERQLELGGI